MADMAEISDHHEFVGCVERIVAGREIVGWAVDLLNQSEKVVVEILADGVPIGSCCCNELRNDIRLDFLADSRLGFRFSLEDQLGLDSAKIITARCVSTRRALWGAVSFSPDLRSFEGEVSIVRGGRIEGWATDTRDPRRPLVLSVFSGADIVATGRTDHPRVSQSDSAGTTARAIFMIDVSTLIDNDAVLNVYIANTSFELQGSPLLCQTSIPQKKSKPFSFILD